MTRHSFEDEVRAARSVHRLLMLTEADVTADAEWFAMGCPPQPGARRLGSCSSEPPALVVNDA